MIASIPWLQSAFIFRLRIELHCKYPEQLSWVFFIVFRLLIKLAWVEILVKQAVSYFMKIILSVRYLLLVEREA